MLYQQINKNMAKEIKLEDFGELAMSLKPSLLTHGIPDELHYSLLSDVVFQCAAFIDEKTGSSFHEGIDALLDEYIEALSGDISSDYMVAEIQIVFGKGRKVETNVLKSHLENKENIVLDFEMALGIRDIDEIDAKIDADARFAALMKKKNGIKSLDFKAAKDFENDNWYSIPLQGSEFGDFEQSIDGILKLVSKVTKQWV